MIEPPVIQRTAPIPIGAVFRFGRRMLRVTRTYGDDPAASVIVLEPSGQYALWAHQGVARALARAKPAELYA